MNRGLVDIRGNEYPLGQTRQRPPDRRFCCEQLPELDVVAQLEQQSPTRGLGVRTPRHVLQDADDDLGGLLPADGRGDLKVVDVSL